MRLDLAAAQRARGMINDPLSMRTLSDYISELEAQLPRGDTPFLLASATPERRATR